MQAESELGIIVNDIRHLRRRRPADKNARAGDDAIRMGVQDSAIDLRTLAEIVGVDDEAFHHLMHHRLIQLSRGLSRSSHYSL